MARNDSDIVERVRNLVDRSKSIIISTDERKESYKDSYRITLNGSRAIEWMMTIYPLMSIRRKAKIRECLNVWKHHKLDTRFVNSPEVKQRIQLTKKLKNLGYDENQIALAGGMRKIGLSYNKIIERLNNALKLMEGSQGSERAIEILLTFIRMHNFHRSKRSRPKREPWKRPLIISR